MAKVLPTLREHVINELAKIGEHHHRVLVRVEPPAFMGAGQLTRPSCPGDQVIDMTQPFGRERAIQAVMELERDIARRCRAKFPRWHTVWRDEEETNAADVPQGSK